MKKKRRRRRRKKKKKKKKKKKRRRKKKHIGSQNLYLIITLLYNFNQRNTLKMRWNVLRLKAIQFLDDSAKLHEK